MDFDGPIIKLVIMHATFPQGLGGYRFRLLAGLGLGLLLAAWPARGTILWSHPEAILVCNNGAGVDLLHGAIAPQDSNSQRTLYFRIHVDPVADSVIKSIGPMEAGFMFVEKGQEHLGIGNSLGAWAYCAMNVPQNRKGYEDLNSSTPEPAHYWEYIRAGVPKYIAFKIEYRPRKAARVTVWMNPDLSGAATELNQPTNIITRCETTATFDEIHLVHRGEGAGWRFSELVAGTSFNDLLLVPFWQRGWFIGLAGAGSLAGVAGLAQLLERRRSRRQILRLEQERTVAAERARIARDIHDELGANLTKIFKLARILEGNPTAAATQAVPQTIAQTARETIQTMDEIVWAVNPNHDSMESLASYLEKFCGGFSPCRRRQMPGGHAAGISELAIDLGIAAQFISRLQRSLEQCGQTCGGFRSADQNGEGCGVSVLYDMTVLPGLLI